MRKLNIGYLSFKESVVITLIPALIFLINGIVVITLKTTQAPITAYCVLPIILIGLVSLVVSRRSKDNDTSWMKGLKTYGPVLLLPLIFTLVHYSVYGTSFGTDTAAYFTNPMHTFFGSGQFSHSEKPFVEFGQQPLAVYWLPANSEFMFVGVGHLFNLEYHQILALMHLVSNYLLGLVLMVIVLRYCNLLNGIMITASVLALLYGLQNSRIDFEATALFRGFENKGLIWGYFFWATMNLMVPGESLEKRPWVWAGAGVILGAASFLVSGNSAFLMFPITAMLLGTLVSGQFRNLWPYLGFFAGLLSLVFIFKMLEVTDVYSVVSKDLTPRPPDSFAIQTPAFMFPIWLWVMSAAIILLAATKSIKLSVQLGVFFAICLIVQTETYFNFCLKNSLEFTLVFWRHASLMNPLVPLLFAGLFLMSRVKVTKRQTAISGSLLAACILAFTSRALTFPEAAPFAKAESKPVMKALSQLCPSDSLILAQIRFASHMPPIQPKYRYLGARQAFLNWQIANLPPESDTRKTATDVRDAIIYLKRDRLTGKYPENRDAIERTLKRQKPDAIIVSKSRLSEDNQYLFSDFTRQAYKGTIVFTTDACRTDFKQLVKKAMNESQ